MAGEGFKKHGLWALFAGVFVLHLLPLLLNGRHAYVRIHDNLEGEWAWLMLLVKWGQALIFSPEAVIPQLLGGQPRMVLPTGLSVNTLLIWLFGGLGGYKVSYVLTRLLAFWGMYRLLHTYFLPNEGDAFLRVGVSLAFSLVPFYVQFGVAIQPFLLYSLLQLLRGRDTWTDWACLPLVPLYSNIVWMGTSTVIVAGLLWLSWSVWKRRVHLRSAIGIGVLAASYAMVNFPLLQLYWAEDFTSHRKAYDALAMLDINFYGSLLEAIFLCAVGHYHVGTVVALPLLVGAGVALFKGRSQGIGRMFRYRLLQLGLCLGLIGILSLVYALYPYLAAPLDDFLPLLSELRLNRMIILLPLLFFVVFALTLRLLRHMGFSRSALGVLVASQLVMGFWSNDEWLHNMRHLVGASVKPGYAEFWAEDLFRRIAAHIGAPPYTYRVASLGIHPVVAQYNGFYTLDGLLSLYSLQHKQRFRAIIADEISKDPRLLAYFDEWGNRCYLFSAELGLSDQNYLIGKDKSVTLKDFRFNVDAFRQLGGRYVFSAVRIEHSERIRLRLSAVFEPKPGEDSWWRVYLYEVI